MISLSVPSTGPLLRSLVLYLSGILTCSQTKSKEIIHRNISRSAFRDEKPRGEAATDFYAFGCSFVITNGPSILHCDDVDRTAGMGSRHCAVGYLM
jgi:hypothetical protein